MSAITSVSALRNASSIARKDSNLALIESRKAGHGAAELARQVKAACPDVSLAACRRAADKVLAVRLARPKGVPSRALGRTPKAVQPLADRLTAFRRANVVTAYRECGFRSTGSPGGIDLDVVIIGASLGDALGVVAVLGPNATARPFASSEMVRTSETYSSRSTWRVQEQVVRIVVPADWGTSVRHRDLAVLDGMLALDAEQLPTVGPVEIYRATWVRQGRGVSLVTESGYIARHMPTGTTYHSTDRNAEKALTGLKRKLTAQGIAPEVRDARRAEQAARRSARQARQLTSLVERIGRYDLSEIDHVEVTRADSIRAGNCIPGTDAFIDRLGFDGRRSATIGEIAHAVRMAGIDPADLSGADLTLARQFAAACLVAIRRDRNARRAIGV